MEKICTSGHPFHLGRQNNPIYCIIEGRIDSRGDNTMKEILKLAHIQDFEMSACCNNSDVTQADCSCA